jgi:hypothetical protein
MENGFRLPATAAARVEPPRLPLRYVWEFLRDGETPLRSLCDEGVRTLMPYLEGDGEIIELGGADDYYKNFAAQGQRYVVTNVDGEQQHLDATQMSLANDSVDAFLSIFALEHIYECQRVIDESWRCLRPGGRMLLAVPFLCYYHAAPDDFFRFTDSAMRRMLANFRIRASFALGNRELLVAMSYHEKALMGSKHSLLGRAALRMIAFPFLAGGLIGNQSDPKYAVGHIYLCEKS